MEEAYHRQTDRQTGDRQAYRNKWRANQMKHRNQDQIMTNVGLLERQRAEAETSANHKRRNERRQKPFSTINVTSPAVQKKQKSRRKPWTFPRKSTGQEHLFPEDAATLAAL